MSFGRFVGSDPRAFPPGVKTLPARGRQCPCLAGLPAFSRYNDPLNPLRSWMSVTTIVPSKLVRVRVEGLLGRFTHDIPFDPSWNFVIIYGPNGIGKTRLFELIHAAFAGDYSSMLQIPFTRIQFLFADETWVEVSRPEDLQLDVGDGHNIGTAQLSHNDVLMWSITPSGGESQVYPIRRLPPHEDPHLVSRIEHRFRGRAT